MLRSMKEMRGYPIRATDGDIGSVHGFYFDDQYWTVRYLVVNVGSWLAGRLILIPRSVFGEPIGGVQTFPVKLSRKQVEGCPETATNKPVSRQHEEEVHVHYGASPYWGVPGLYDVQLLGFMSPWPDEEDATGHDQGDRQEEAEIRDPHLRSSPEIVSNYNIQATDGEFGHVEDFTVDDENWTIRYLTVDTRRWLPGKKVLIASDWVARVCWPDRVYVDVTRKQMEDSPEYDPSMPVIRQYEERLYDFYGRPKYWDKA